jgi:hypothetical protein
MRRMPDDEPTPVERTGLPRSTTFFRPSTPSRAMRTCCSSWGYDSCCAHAAGWWEAFVHGGILLDPAGAGDGPRAEHGHRPRAVMAPLCMRLATPISLGYR